MLDKLIVYLIHNPLNIKRYFHRSGSLFLQDGLQITAWSKSVFCLNVKECLTYIYFFLAFKQTTVGIGCIAVWILDSTTHLPAAYPRRW